MQMSESLKCLRLAETREWIETQPVEKPTDDESDDVDESSESDFASDTEDEGSTTTLLGTQIAHNEDIYTITQKLQEVLNFANSVQTVDNVQIENSTNVQIGNVTNINGNIQIIHTGSDRFQSRCKRRTQKGSRSHTVEKTPASVPSPTVEEREERVQRDAFMDRIKYKIPKDVCTIVPRNAWLAQTPLVEPEYLQEPVEAVIISHTATESSEKQAVNIGLIHDIQYFHVQSREWNDIAYNFLVGCDGNVYEGRGWGVVGAHTVGYNTRSIGISFIGCFMNELPSKAALNSCRTFLKRGVKEGHLAANYKLLCHCQCRPTESPGRKLFEEIQNWDHFYSIEQETDEE